LGAKLVPFGGWEMPVQYSGIREEHQAVRQRVGLFDISHMGEFLVTGGDRLNRVLTNDLRKLGVGQGQYTLLCNAAGGVLDDLIVYRVGPDQFLMIVNAANIEADRAWLREQGIPVEDQSAQTAALALQGPLAAKFLENSAALPAFGIERESVFGQICWVARTGYTGEDGFEILCAADAAAELWDELLEFGAEFGIRPCGLGARDTLRLEACLPLHGHELKETITPVEAGLTRFVAWDKGEFVGRPVLAAQREKGVARQLVAFKMAAEKCPPPRARYRLLGGDAAIGEVTSGSLSPTLGVGIGMGYVGSAWAPVGQRIEVEIRGKLYAAVVEKKPLYKRGQ
jgi:aminomethyltransferase